MIKLFVPPTLPPMMAGSGHRGVPARTLEDLDFGRIVERLSQHARTVLGQRLALDVPLHHDRGRVEAALNLTVEMAKVLDQGLSPPLSGATDLTGLLERATREGVLDAEDVLRVADTARAAWLTLRFADRAAELAPSVAELARRLPEMELHEALYELFDDDGALVDNASEELKSLRAKKRSLHERIRARVRSLAKAPDLEEFLQDSYYTLREDRYVLPVRSGERAHVDGIIHGSSHTGATLFIEPAELVPLNNDLKMCEQEVLAEERRILARLTAEIASHSFVLEQIMDVLAQLDLVIARAQLALDMDACAPRLAPDDTVALKKARNPLLVLRKIPVVPNDIELGAERRTLVITGPNAGGKTVTLSTLGLFGLMTRAGMLLPCAPDSVIPLFEKVLTVLGDHQDLQADLSTFSGHIARVQEVLAAVSERSLVLLDEVAVGTAPGQGAALAIAILEKLQERGAVTAVTTHYERLKTLSLEDPRFVNAAVVLDDRSGAPSYELRLGMPGSSSALEMALRLGLDAAVVDRARAIVGDRALSVERVVQRLEAERMKLESERKQLAQELSDVSMERDALKRERRRLSEDGERVIRETKAEALNELGQARETIASIVRELQKSKDPRVIEKRRRKLADVEEQLRGQEKAKAEAEAGPEPLAKEDIVVGNKALLASVGQVGIITQIRGSKVELTIGNVRTTVKPADLLTPPSGKKPKAEKKKPKEKAVKIIEIAAPGEPMRSPDLTCDVRGLMVDDAMVKLESFLDDLVLLNKGNAFVLHGHGTGRLRDGLRRQLKRSRYVARHAPGGPDQGGDAVTVIWLK